MCADASSAAFRADLGNVRMLEGRLQDAIGAYRAATEIDPDHALAWGNLASALHARGELGEAADAARRGLAAEAQDTESIASLGRTLLACGAADEAESACRRALELAPGHVGVLQTLGHALLERAAFAAALECFTHVVEAQPSLAIAHTWLGTALERTGDVEGAIAACTRAVEMAPGDPEAHAGLAGVQWRARRLGAAIRQYRRAVEIDPTRLEPRANLAALLELTSDLDAATAEARAGLDLHPHDPYLNLTAARCARRAGDREGALARLEGVDASSAGLDLRAQINYQTGQLRDALGDHAGAMTAWREANSLAAASPEARAVDRQRYLDEIDAARVVVPRLAALADPAAAPAAEESPVFVIGFPRSGTTLTDQILDSHPGACTLSEKPAIDKVVDWLATGEGGYPASLETAPPGELEALRGTYDTVASSFVRPTPGAILVDRYPLNLVRLPAIWRLFPNARIVLAIRHPCDVVLSCYMQHFALNDAMASFLDLEDAARLYDAVMSLWRDCVEHLEIEHHVLRYESLIGNFDAEVRALLEHVGLPWDDAVRGFAEHARNRADINTPSYHQVTRGIYADARERWRHYEDSMAPALPILAPWVEHFGY